LLKIKKDLQYNILEKYYTYSLNDIEYNLIKAKNYFYLFRKFLINNVNYNISITRDQYKMKLNKIYTIEGKEYCNINYFKYKRMIYTKINIKKRKMFLYISPNILYLQSNYSLIYLYIVFVLSRYL
jgi:hypothetical protein